MFFALSIFTGTAPLRKDNSVKRKPFIVIKVQTITKEKQLKKQQKTNKITCQNIPDENFVEVHGTHKGSEKKTFSFREKSVLQKKLNNKLNKKNSNTPLTDLGINM